MVRRSCHFAFPAVVRPASLVVLALATAVACGGGSGSTAKGAKRAAGSACLSKDTTPVTLAVRDYISTASPTPQRYLSAAGTDSAVPQDGFKVLQDKGPTYFYGGDSVAQRKIREKLASVGPYASLLVLFRGKSEADGVSLTMDHVIPFSRGGETSEGNLVTLTLSGAQLLELLESQWKGQVGSGRVLHVSSGFTYSWDAARPRLRSAGWICHALSSPRLAMPTTPSPR